MPHYIRGDGHVMECLLEKALKNMRFVVVKDGEKDNGLTQAGEAPSFFTRILRWYPDGSDKPPINTWVKIVYDRRTGDAEISVSYKDLEEFERVEAERFAKLVGGL